MNTTFIAAGLLLSILLIGDVSNAQTIHQNKKALNMSTEQKNKEVVRRLYEEALNKKDLGIISGLIAEDYIGAQGKKGPSAFSALVAALLAAFPDIQWELEDLIGEGDKVSVRWTWHGTMTAPYREIAPTGKKITNEGIAIYRLRDGKIIEGQLQTDRLGFLQTMDILPPDPILAFVKQAHKDGVYFIDKFLLPAAAKKEFYERMSINRNFIRSLPGFIGDEAYEYTDDKDNLICITVAHWANQEAINKAKGAVQEEYKKEGFDPAAMFRRLNIVIDRGIYTLVKD